jgi:hypothetical protein
MINIKTIKTEKTKIIPDLSNIVNYHSKNGEGAKIELFHKMQAKLMELGFLKENIVNFCDMSLLYTIDDKDELKKLIKSGEIHPAPAGSRADDFILSFAQSHPASMIISNDNFRDYKAEVRKEWLKEHRIAFMFVEDEVLLCPCGDANPKVKQTQKKPLKSSNPKITEKKTETKIQNNLQECSAIDIFAKITSGVQQEFQLYQNLEEN